MKFFYTQKKLTVVCGDNNHRLFHAAAVTLAEHTGGTVATPLGIDLQGSIAAWHCTGQISHRSYTPYGFLKSLAPSEPRWAYTGEQPDISSQCYHLGNGHRVYNPALMRFQSPDTMSPFGQGGIHAYAYCVGDPINATDPSGQVRRPFLSQSGPPRLPTFSRPQRTSRLELQAQSSAPTQPRPVTEIPVKTARKAVDIFIKEADSANVVTAGLRNYDAQEILTGYITSADRLSAQQATILIAAEIFPSLPHPNLNQKDSAVISALANKQFVGDYQFTDIFLRATAMTDMASVRRDPIHKGSFLHPKRS